jgi:PAS domain S-box-containing protein
LGIEEQYHRQREATPFVSGAPVVRQVEHPMQHHIVEDSDDKFRSIYDNAPIGIFQSTPEGRFLRVNSALANFFGYNSPREMISAVVDIPKQIIVHPEQREEIIREALHTQGFVRREIEYRRRDRSVFIANLYVRAVRDVNGAVSFLEGFVEDITERKQAEAMLLESERKYRELVENANSIIIRWGRDGKIKFLNEFGQKFFDYAEEELIGRHVVGTIVPETDDIGRDLSLMMDRICANPMDFEQNINENMRRNGERVWIAWANKPVLDDQGNVLEVFSVGTDITERRQVELELENTVDIWRSW